MPRTVLSAAGQAVSGGAISQSRLLRWLAYAAFAIGGSCWFGASLSWVEPAWLLPSAALWLALSAGLAWAVFIPVLARFTRVGLLECAEAALTTMAVGEVVLVSGVLVNALLARCHLLGPAAAINMAIVALSNASMAAALDTQLRRYGVSLWRTVALWLVVLDGAGALFFAVLYPLLHGR